jgi:hypothetical protein
MRVGAWMVGVGLLLAAHGVSAATLEYSSDFEACSPCGFAGAGGIESTQGYATLHPAFGSLFLRNATGGNPAASSTLSLSGLAAHTQLELSFLLAVIDSWDGTAPVDGPDAFNVKVDGTLVFSGTYTNFAGGEAYQGTRLFFAQDAGFSSGLAVDSAYLIGFTVPHTASTASIEFFADGEGYGGGTDESWAIDNLAVTSGVPEPRSILLLLSGAAALFAARRRK